MASQTLAQRVWQRARVRCEYCQMPQEFDPLPFQIDHIIARKHRGRTRMENLALACFACNNHKGPNIAGIDPDTYAVTPLFHPRRDDWQEHFIWHGPELVGRTPIGRATIAVLAINLPRRVTLRRALMEEGVFPPP
jgi:HNH endonuclease